MNVRVLFAIETARVHSCTHIRQNFSKIFSKITFAISKKEKVAEKTYFLIYPIEIDLWSLWGLSVSLWRPQKRGNKLKASNFGQTPSTRCLKEKAGVVKYNSYENNNNGNSIGWGLVGRVVASNTRGPRFESSHWRKILWNNLFIVNCLQKTKKEKEARNNSCFNNDNSNNKDDHNNNYALNHQCLKYKIIRTLLSFNIL